jgi:FkbM family methyltransferase
MLKQLAAYLPLAWQQLLRRWKCRVDMKTGRFRPLDPEFDYLDKLLKPGDWTLDIGANVGYYTLRLSEIVGPSGRVFAFEPISLTVEVLAANVRYAKYGNITIFQTAVAERPGLLDFSVEAGRGGLPDYFTAHNTVAGGVGNFSVFATTIDSQQIAHRVALAKIDTEGSEERVLRGMAGLINRDHPVLIVECTQESVGNITGFLANFGYSPVPRKGRSANILFLPPEIADTDQFQRAAPHYSRAIR